MVKRQAKKQKTDSTCNSLSNVMLQISTAHQILRKLVNKAAEVDHILLSQIGDEMQALEATRQQVVQSKPLNWEPIMHMNNTHWSKLLAVADWLALAQCSSTMFSLVSPHISTKFAFKQTYFKFGRYSPVIVKEVTNLHLPEGVTHIFFDWRFDKPLYQLPSSVTHLNFGNKFNQEIKNLPDSVLSIEFPAYTGFNKRIEFPPSLTHLINARYYPHTITSLPATLTHLKIFNLFPAKLLEPLSDLKSLTVTLETHIHHFPPALEILQATFCKNQPLAILPSSLKKLTIHGIFDHIDDLPSSITHLTLLGTVNNPVTNFPSSLVQLTFGFNFNQPIDNLPLSLTHLTFGYCFNQPISNFPPFLTNLVFGEKFNQTLVNVPVSITHLEIGGKCEHVLKSYTSLSHLTITSHYDNIPLDKLPNSLTHLHVDDSSILIRQSLPPLTHFTSYSDFNDDLAQFEFLPRTITYFQFSSDDVKLFRPSEQDTKVRTPAAEYFNLRTTEYDFSMHFQLGKNSKRFQFEVVAHAEEDCSVTLQVFVNFTTFEICISHKTQTD